MIDSPMHDTIVGSRADHGLYAVSLQVTSHKPSGRLLLLSARPGLPS